MKDQKKSPLNYPEILSENAYEFELERGNKDSYETLGYALPSTLYQLQFNEVRIVEAPPDQFRAATNGKIIVLNGRHPFMNDQKKLAAVMAEERLHISLLHKHRMGGRDKEMWNIACDIYINSLFHVDERCSGRLVISNSLPNLYQLAAMLRTSRSQGEVCQKIINDPSPWKVSEEDIYDALQEMSSGNYSEKKKCNQLKDDSSGKEDIGIDEEWDDSVDEGEIVGQIMNADQQLDKTNSGNDTDEDEAGNRRSIDGSVVHTMVLRVRSDGFKLSERMLKFLEDNTKERYSFSRPSKRFMSMGIVFPGIIKPKSIRRIVFAIDISGSMNKVQLDKSTRALKGIIDQTQFEEVIIMTCNTTVTSVSRYSRENLPDVLSLNRGGGTSFTPVLKEIKNHYQDAPVLIYYTDLDGDTESHFNSYHSTYTPDLKILWLSAARGVGRRELLGKRLAGYVGEYVSVGIS